MLTQYLKEQKIFLWVVVLSFVTFGVPTPVFAVEGEDFINLSSMDSEDSMGEIAVDEFEFFSDPGLTDSGSLAPEGVGLYLPDDVGLYLPDDEEVTEDVSVEAPVEENKELSEKLNKLGERFFADTLTDAEKDEIAKKYGEIQAKKINGVLSDDEKLWDTFFATLQAADEKDFNTILIDKAAKDIAKDLDAEIKKNTPEGGTEADGISNMAGQTMALLEGIDKDLFSGFQMTQVQKDIYQHLKEHYAEGLNNSDPTEIAYVLNVGYSLWIGIMFPTNPINMYLNQQHADGAFEEGSIWDGDWPTETDQADDVSGSESSLDLYNDSETV